jgi:hypothetical protein
VVVCIADDQVNEAPNPLEPWLSSDDDRFHNTFGCCDSRAAENDRKKQGEYAHGAMWSNDQAQ